MKKLIRIVLFSIFFLMMLLFAGYFLLAYYYRQGFALNTWINGVYCTGKSVEEVNSELLSKVEAPIVIMKDKAGKEYEIRLEEVDYKVDYMTPLQKYMQDQKPLLWIDNVTFHKNHNVMPLATYDGNKLKEVFYSLPPIVEEQKKKEDYYIAWNAETGDYSLYDNLSGRMDIEKAYICLVSAIDAGENVVDLSLLNCYYDIPLNQEQEQIRWLWEKLEYFQNCDLIYDMGTEKIAFTSQIVSRFLECTEMPENLPVLDENGELVISQDAVEIFIEELANQYDTYGKERKFMSTRGEEITLTQGTYGTTLNQKAEVNYLMEHLLLPDMHTGEKKEHIPEYRREAFARGLDDIGDTYIEIDMTDQKLYYYQECELQLETDIVTGNMRRKMGTPSGVYYVYNKQKNRILRGPGYASKVDFWMPVKGSIGIHDAAWRDEFGGEIYKKNGSHGCINLPKDVMPNLYEMVEIGTPVVMFY